MKDIMIIVILVLIVGAAAFYVYKAKKSGQKCIGCPEGCSCNAKNGNGSCCCGDTKVK